MPSSQRTSGRARTQSNRAKAAEEDVQAKAARSQARKAAATKRTAAQPARAQTTKKTKTTTKKAPPPPPSPSESSESSEATAMEPVDYEGLFKAPYRILLQLSVHDTGAKPMFGNSVLHDMDKQEAEDADSSIIDLTITTQTT